jgi:hypothetical protein
MSLPTSKLLDEPANVDCSNLQIDIAMIREQITAMSISRLAKSAFVASSRSLLRSEGMIVTAVHGHDVDAGVESGEVLLEPCLTLAGAGVVVWREGAPGCYRWEDLLASPLAAERINAWAVASATRIVSGYVNAGEAAGAVAAARAEQCLGSSQYHNDSERVVRCW